MKKIALVVFDIKSLTGGGGAERQFTHTYEYYQVKEDKKFTLFYILDLLSFQVLTQLGILKSTDNVIVLKKYSFIPRKFRKIFWSLEIIFKARKHKLELLHLYQPSIINGLSVIFSRLFPKRPLITVNINDCTLAHTYLSSDIPDAGGNVYKNRLLFKHFRFDGYFSWYKLFLEVAQKHKAVKGKPIIKAAKYCFASQGYQPDTKQNLIVYAGRLSPQKDPLFFLKALLFLYKNYPESIKKWEIKLFGHGPLKDTLLDFIKQHEMQEVVEITSTNSMVEVFSKSKLFISSQLYENFTSLSMLEAMASGNAIIARDVGQTDYFVKDGKNGYILKEDTPENMGELIYQYIKAPELHQSMQDYSVHIANDVHSVQNFLTDLEDFWDTFFKR